MKYCRPWLLLLSAASLCFFDGIAAGQRSLKTLKGHILPISAVTISPDGKMLASGDAYANKPGTVRLWELSTGQQRLAFQLHTDGISGLSFSPDGRLIASASHDKTTRLWQVSTGTQLATLELRGVPWDPWFSPDGRRLLVMSHGHSFQLWDLRNPKKPQLLYTPLSNLRPAGPVDLSPDRKTLALSYNFNTTANGRGKRGDIILHEVKSGKVRRRLRTQGDAMIEHLSFSPNGIRLAVAAGKEIVVWHIGKELKSFSLRGHRSDVLVATFSPDGKLLASGDYAGIVKLWNLQTHRLLATFSEHTSRITQIVYTPDGKLIISSSSDTTLKVWRSR